MKLMNSSLLTAFSGVIAMPFSHLVKNLPGDIAHIAVDKAEGHYLALKRDGTISYSSPMISNIVLLASAPNFRLAKPNPVIPGWNTIVGYVNNQWGGGSRNIDTSPAAVCITDDVVELSYPGNPVCQTYATSTEGSLVDTDGQVQIAVQQGFNSDTWYTFSSASTVGVSGTLSVEIGIPEIAGVTAELSASTDITDESSFITLAPAYRTEQLRCFL
ncbi:uncharacterized protein ARMOST_20126 [Armillaria ostoyae]|uniref:Uncharacterized protein n=1 Tax=Armillaria ostoyae TaxID=47428 RepID=A0A284S6H3_ARMOS|nr:uncharacterized protein ARMOST_20126 [Armillaria ostoyae]